MEEQIIAPIPKEVLLSELTEEKRLRLTNKSNNEIYIVTWQNSPNVVKEIGRLREIVFRAAGGGTLALVAIVIFLEPTWKWTSMVSRNWLQPTCSISLISS